MNRIEANKELLEILRETLCKNPELRFIQALWNLKIIDKEPSWNPGEVNPPIDRFYEESVRTLERVETELIFSKLS